MIAFAYCNSHPDLDATYMALCQGLVENIKDVMPGQEILMVSDERTPFVKGINGILRVEKTMPLMVWRLKAHQAAHSFGDDIMFTEPDVRFRENVMDDFTADFDIAITSRETPLKTNDGKYNTDFTLGMTFSRSPDFWREAKIYCQSLGEKEQLWFGDMLSIAHVIDGKQFNVKMLDGSIYNHVVNDPEQPTDAKVLHYKGQRRKQWLFPRAVEAA